MNIGPGPAPRAWRVEMASQISQLHRFIKDIQEEGRALQDCLQDLGLVSRTRVQVRVKNNKFVEDSRRHGWRSDGHIDDLIKTPELTSALLAWHPGCTHALRPTAQRFVTLEGPVLPRLCVFATELGRTERSWTQGTWEPLPNPWGARGVKDSSASSLGGKLYVLGGGPYNGVLNKCFDPASRTWRSMRSMLTPRRRHASTVVGHRLYVVGGELGPWPILSVECFDPESGSKGEWTQTVDLLEARSDCLAVALQGQLFVCGGIDITTNFAVALSEWIPAQGPGVVRFARDELQDMMLPPRFLHTGVVIRDQLYVCGGMITEYGFGMSTSALHYDPLGRPCWEELPPQPTPRWGARAVSLAGSMYVLGGANHISGFRLDSPSYPNENRLMSVERFNPETGVWETLPPMSQPRARFSVGAVIM